MNRKIKRIFIYVILTVLLAGFLFPVGISLTNSFMSTQETYIRYTSSYTPENSFHKEGNIHYAEMSVIPEKVTLSQYFDLFTKNPAYLAAFYNSIKLTTPVVFGQLIIGMIIAYWFEVSRFRFKEYIFFLYIVVMFMPLQVTLVPNYMMVQFLGINGTYLAIILPGVFSPFAVFLFRQYLKSIPKEYIEAARIDGAGELRIIGLIVAPIMKPAIAAMVILTFTSYWNMVEQAIIFIKEGYDKPLSTYLSRMATDNMGMVFAAACFYMLPALLIFIYGQKSMMEGMAQSFKL